jgi:anti-sigma regulatory factor (Ser/Thr protein kinase)
MSERSRLDVLADVSLSSDPDGRRRARRLLVEAVAPLRLASGRREALETAVAEAVMNAIEHGNGGDPDLAVRLRVTADRDVVVVRVADEGGHEGEVALGTTPPDLEAKLRGDEPLRGWGLFLMQALVDEVRIERGDAGRTVQLLLRRRDQPTT